MKKMRIILLFLAVFLLFTACSSNKTSSQQVIMSNIDTSNISPSPIATTAAPQVSPTPIQSDKTQDNVSQPTVTPAGANTPVPSKTAATPAASESPTPVVKTDPLVFIDAGHGGNDPGASGNGIIEKNITLDIAKRLNQALLNSNVKTYMVRTSDTFIDHRDRIYLANNMNASLYISIHCDWYENPKYSGTQTFYTTAKELKLGELTELQYTKYVHNELINTLKSNNRGIVDRPTLAAVKYANMPSILIETGFLSNPTEAANLANGDYRQKIADAMASGVQQSLKKANLR